MGNLEKAFRYPFTGQDWRIKFALGGLLYILGIALGFIPWMGVIFWLLVIFFPLGYAYQVFQGHLRGADAPLPGWRGWGGLFARGWFVFLVSLAYAVIPLVLYWLGKALWYGGGFGAFLGVLFIILGVGIGLVTFFLLPMALALFAKENESFGAAFRWSGIVEKIWMVQREYFLGWLTTLLFFLILLFVREYFLYIGWVLYALGTFYLSLVAASFFGNLSREALEMRR